MGCSLCPFPSSAPKIWAWTFILKRSPQIPPAQKQPLAQPRKHRALSVTIQRVPEGDEPSREDAIGLLSHSRWGQGPGGRDPRLQQPSTLPRHCKESFPGISPNQKEQATWKGPEALSHKTLRMKNTHG